MSPFAPGRMAKIGWIGRLPLGTKIKLSPAIGVGMVTSDFFASRHNSLPVTGSYPRAYWAAFVTSSTPPAVFHSVGELQEGISSRGVDQACEPSSSRYAATNESFPTSH